MDGDPSARRFITNYYSYQGQRQSDADGAFDPSPQYGSSNRDFMHSQDSLREKQAILDEAHKIIEEERNKLQPELGGQRQDIFDQSKVTSFEEEPCANRESYRRSYNERSSLDYSNWQSSRGSFGGPSTSSIEQDVMSKNDYPSTSHRSEKRWRNRDRDFGEKYPRMDQNFSNTNTFSSSSNRDMSWGDKNESYFSYGINQAGDRDTSQHQRGKGWSRGRGRAQTSIVSERQGMGRGWSRGRGRAQTSIVSERQGMGRGWFHPEVQSIERNREEVLQNPSWGAQFSDTQNSSKDMEWMRDPNQGFSSSQSYLKEKTIEKMQQKSKSMSQNNLKEDLDTFGGRNLFVGNLPKTCNEGQLKRFFKVYGRIRAARVHKDIVTKEALCMGKVSFYEPFSVQEAISHRPLFMDGLKLRLSDSKFASKKKPGLPRHNRHSSVYRANREAIANASDITKWTSKKKKKKLRNEVVGSKLWLKLEKAKLFNWQKSRNKGECQKPPGDPHHLCVFCRAQYTANVEGCVKKRCFECMNLNKTQYKNLKPFWLEQMNDTTHPCYWNLDILTKVLEPYNVTPKTATCAVCSNTIYLDQKKVDHLHEPKHLKAVATKREIHRQAFTDAYMSCVEACEEEEITGASLKFCTECFMSYRNEDNHKKSVAHLMIKRSLPMKCEICEREDIEDIDRHVYTYYHLRNAWHHKVVLQGEVSSEDTECFGADFVKEAVAAWCLACEYYMDSNGVTFMEHCKTENHFYRTKKVIAVREASKELQTMMQEQRTEERNRQSEVSEENEDDASLINDSADDDAAVEIKEDIVDADNKFDE